MLVQRPLSWSLKIGGEGRIRTFETFVAELQSAPFDRSGTSPFYTYFSVALYSTTQPSKMVPAHGFELWTYWLQVSCSTNWAMPAFLSVSYVSYRNGVQFSKTQNPCKCFFQKKRQKLTKSIRLTIIQPLWSLRELLFGFHSTQIQDLSRKQAPLLPEHRPYFHE